MISEEEQQRNCEKIKGMTVILRSMTKKHAKIVRYIPPCVFEVISPRGKTHYWPSEDVITPEGKPVDEAI